MRVMDDLPLFADQILTSSYFEERAQKRGFHSVAGIDEAGRGPLAGPVVAAAVILPSHFELPGLTDSKKLSAKKREYFYPQIRNLARSVGVGVASVAEIDEINILQATLLAMQRAIDRLTVPPDYLLVDGITAIPVDIAQETLIKGDSRSLSIAAASVVAKVIRDRIMKTYDGLYPVYGFAAHKGYGTAMHRQSIAEFGPSPQHRLTFAGVKEHVGIVK
jgi:ribonuclease HII